MTEDYNGGTKSLALTIFIQVLVHVKEYYKARFAEINYT